MNGSVNGGVTGESNAPHVICKPALPEERRGEIRRLTQFHPPRRAAAPAVAELRAHVDSEATHFLLADRHFALMQMSPYLFALSVDLLPSEERWYFRSLGEARCSVISDSPEIVNLSPRLDWSRH